MDHRVAPGDGAIDGGAIRDRADQLRVGTGRDVQTDHLMPVRPQPGCQKPAEPAGRTGQKNTQTLLPSPFIMTVPKGRSPFA